MAEVYDYGKDPRYPTIKQKRKKRFQEHPIRSTALVPLTFCVDFVKSCNVIGDNILPFFAEFVKILFTVVLLVVFGPAQLLFSLFWHGNKYNGFGFRVPMVILAAADILVGFGILNTQAFMPWTFVSGLPEFLWSFVPDINAPDVLQVPFFFVQIFFAGWMFLFLLIGVLFYGVMNNLIAFLVFALFTAISLISISVNGSGLKSYLWYVWTDYTDKWPRLVEEILFGISLIRYLVPFVNLYYHDRDTYYRMLRNGLL